MVWSFSNLGLDRLQKNRNEIAKRISKCLTELLRSFKASTHSFNQIDQYTYASLMFSYHVKNAVLHLQLNLSKKIYTKKYAPHTMENIRYAQTKYLYFKKWTLAILSFNSFPKHMQMHIFKYTRKFIFFQLTAYPVCKKHIVCIVFAQMKTHSLLAKSKLYKDIVNISSPPYFKE